MDTAVHSVDLFRFLVGEIVEQNAVLETHLPGIQVEDTAVLSLRADSGCLGVVICSWVAGSDVALIDMVGQKGRMVYNYLEPTSVELWSGRKDRQMVEVEQSNGFAEEIGHFLGAVRGSHPLGCTGYDGLKAVEVIHRAYNQAASFPEAG